VKKNLIFKFSFTICGLVLFGCGGHHQNKTTISVVSYEGVFPDVQMSLTSNGFSAMSKKTYSTSSLSFSLIGLKSLCNNNFTQFNVTSSNNTVNTSSSAVFYGIEIPTFGMLIAPFDSQNPDQLVTLLCSDSCPSQTTATNWVLNKMSASKTALKSNFFGSFEYSVSTSIPFLSSFYLLGSQNSNDSQSFESQVCSNGSFHLNNTLSSDNAVFYLNAQGGLILNTSENQALTTELFLGLPSEQIDPQNYPFQYSGFLYQSSRNTNFRVLPIFAQISLFGSGLKINATLLNNVASDGKSLEGLIASFSSVNTPQSGFMQGSLSMQNSVYGNSATNITCTAASNLGTLNQSVIFCAGQDPGNLNAGSGYGLFNLWLVSRT
jgi:hypothetical protein